MTTDVKEEPVPTITVETKKESQTELVKNPNDELLSKLEQMFDQKIKAVTDSFEEKLKKQEEVISEKDAQIEKLKQTNANMALTSNFAKENNGQPDYSSMDFDEVDFSGQAKSFLDNIDAKIFDLKAKTN